MRLASWALLIAFAGAFYAVVVSPLSGVGKLLPLELIYCVPIAVTVALSWRARALGSGVERVFWTCLAAANATLLACEALLVVWVLAINPAGPPPVSWPFHIMHGIAAVSFIGLLVSMSRLGNADLTTRLRWALDVVAFMLFVAVVLLELYVRPVMSQAHAPYGYVLLGVGYPLFGLTLLLGTMGNVVGFKMGTWRPWDKLVAVSLSIYGIAISLWPAWYVSAVAAGTSRNVERGILDLVQFSGHWILMLAAVYRITEPTGWQLRPLPPTAVSGRRRWESAIAPALMVVAIPFVALAAYESHATPEWFVTYIIIATVITLLILARSVVMSLEHGVLFHRSITDALTGAYNRRFFHERMSIELTHAQHYGTQVSLIMLDIDDFGPYNDRFGHLVGDKVLIDFVRLVNNAVPQTHTVARLGGDEFAVIAPETDTLEAAVLARRILDVVSIEAGTFPGSLAVSAGIATYPDHADGVEQLIRVADGALYHSKESGKAKTTIYEPDRVPDLNARERIARLERQSRLSAVQALAAAVDSQGAAMQDHSRHVADLCARVAKLMRFDAEALRRTEAAAMLHDVGNLGVSDTLLQKAGALDSHEWAEVREHTLFGQRILAAAGLTELLPIVRAHHERWDGTGYPDGLQGIEIPVEARVIAVCDAYDAMVSERPYRHQMSREAAMEELRAYAGRQFDPAVVDAFHAVFESEHAEEAES